MSQFNVVFESASIYSMLFLNVKSVLENESLSQLSENNPKLLKYWNHAAVTKFNSDPSSNEDYLKNAVYLPEFCKIVCISFGVVSVEDNQMKRKFLKFTDENEADLITNFFNGLNSFLGDGGSKRYILTGHNIMGYDIPMIIKRAIKTIDGKIPTILKNSLSSKPWESTIIDTYNVWKFNGYDSMSLDGISDFIGLKKNIDIMSMGQISNYYWNNIKENSEQCIDTITLQSANQINLTIQLINKLRTY